MTKPAESTTTAGRIATFIVDLGSDSAVARNRAQLALVSLRAAAVEPLIGALRTSTEYGRGQAARTLGEIGDVRAAPGLAEALADDKFDVRWLAARAVVALGRPGLVALLQALSQHPHSTLLRESAHHVLHDEAQEECSQQLAPVLRALEGPDPEVAVPLAATNALRMISNRPTKRAAGAAR